MIKGSIILTLAYYASLFFYKIKYQQQAKIMEKNNSYNLIGDADNSIPESDSINTEKESSSEIYNDSNLELKKSSKKLHKHPNKIFTESDIESTAIINSKDETSIETVIASTDVNVPKIEKDKKDEAKIEIDLNPTNHLQVESEDTNTGLEENVKENMGYLYNAHTINKKQKQRSL